MGYSGFAIGVSPSADWVFALAMLLEERRRAVRGGRMHPSEPSVASARCSWRRSAPGDRAAAPGRLGAQSPRYPRGAAAQWPHFGFGLWVDSGVKGGGSGSPKVDYLVLINWI